MAEKRQNDMELERCALERTLSIAREQLDRATRANAGNRDAILDAKRELRENTVHSISGLWTNDGFEDLVALNQYANPVTNKLAEYEATERRIGVLKKTLDSPYFARLDFKFEDESVYESVYIGRSSLRNEDTFELVVYDWRSPIASMFYRFTTGAAFYDAPGGRIDGDIRLKRQYEIRGGTLIYFFDADVQIMDEFLRKLLAQNASPQMKSIVETIQKEQDIVIRDMETELMMVQGVAGSGKTSIALHRAAYLMYQGLSKSLAPQNILIISPNALFEQYIANVLPELGEENVVSVVLEEMITQILSGKNIQTRNQFLEIQFTNPRFRGLMQRSIEFKTSAAFIEILNRYARDLKSRRTAPGDAESLFRELLKDAPYFYSVAEGLSLPEDVEDIIRYTLENLCGKTVYYDDAAVLAYLQVKCSGTQEYRNIRHVVIDEAQDYYPLHYALFDLLFQKAKYTILGDICQTIEKGADMSMYTQIGGILGRKKTMLIQLDKSFRCTGEILDFSAQFLPRPVKMERFNRQGNEPTIHAADGPDSLSAQIVAEARQCVLEGYQSVALLLKTEGNARTLFERIKDRLDVRIIRNESLADLRGVFIMPVYMAKGLEFDAVLICDANGEYYHSEEDRNLLYVACTRALHKLSLFYAGDMSPFLRQTGL